MRYFVTTLLLLVTLLRANSMSLCGRFLLLSSIKPVQHKLTVPSNTMAKPLAAIPRYQIPKGSIFCIMEDKLTKATGIWIKVGVK